MIKLLLYKHMTLKIIQLALLPISLLYQGILRLRNHLYDIDFFGTSEFEIPTINVGNLAFGGTGKTPHIEFLIEVLSKVPLKVAVLSRGFKRKTSGYIFADKTCNPFTIGDEPYQLYSKFPDISVAVSENRVLGIPNLLMDAPETDIILLDDAYQHRALKPGLNILLTEQDKLYCNDYLVPSGYLREYADAAKRADIIIISKCDPKLSESNKTEIINQLKPLPSQKLFFSSIVYGNLIPFHQDQKETSATAVLGICGIARPAIFENHLKCYYHEVSFLDYPDHHIFKQKDIEKIKQVFDEIRAEKKLIICTEKDYQKLIQCECFNQIEKLPIFYLPIKIAFSAKEELAFTNTILEYVKGNPRKY